MKFKKSFALFWAIFFVFSFTASSEVAENHNYIPTSVSAVSQKMLIPDGRCVGVMLSTKGVLVVDFLDIEAMDGKHPSPAKAAGLKSGDLIQKLEGKKISSVDELLHEVTSLEGKKFSFTINRKGKIMDVLIEPKKSKEDGKLKIGAWVKDAASGIGTLTFFDPDTKKFAALGHGISDPETGEVLSIEDGNILPADIVSVNKGERGSPGELNGIFKENADILGQITKNGTSGISGNATNFFSVLGSPIPICNRNDVILGEAKILSTVSGNQPQEFSIKIIKLMPKVISHQKGMVIEITDARLLEKTGGIVQGMSGSPIIQNGKLVGAVTHVFVNDPSKGYAIFIEDMLT